jgi:hypothetical protein
VCTELYRTLYDTPLPPEDPETAMNDFTSLLGDRFDNKAKDLLRSPLLEPELKAAAFAMASDKSPGPDGVIVEFYTSLWDIIGQEFAQMVINLVQCGQLPQGVNQGLIILLHKGGEREDLTNWRPICLLNVAYKIVAKALQHRLQVALLEVISVD